MSIKQKLNYDSKKYYYEINSCKIFVFKIATRVSGQTNNSEGTQAHLLADKWIKVLLNSAQPSNSQLYTPAVPPIRKRAQAS